jgi:hypothetical protein
MRQMNANTNRHVFGNTFLAAVVAGLLVASSVLAQPATAPAAAPSAAPKEGKKIEQKNPGEMATQICTLLANRRTPWQLYDSYISIFQEYALRQSRVPVATAEAQVQRQRWVAHYQGMASLLQQMQECAKVRDGIKLNRTDVPPHERREAFREANQQFDVHFQKFVAMSQRLPGFKMDPKFVNRPSATPPAVPVGEGDLIR